MSDLFRFFNAAVAGDMRYVDNMSDDEVKGISPYVLLGWGMGATNNEEIRTITTDVYLNDKVFPLAKHPRLLHKLFVAAHSDLGHTKFKYVKSGGKSSSKEVIAITKQYNCSVREAKDYARILSDDDKARLVEIWKEA